MVFLGLAGLRILFGAGGNAGIEGDLPTMPLLLASAFAIGLGGGFLAPILGVGGGLLMVPGLYFAIEGLSFSAARATSLAGGSLASARSIFLHKKAGNIDFASALPLALGALGGAVVGTFSVRSSFLLEVGRMGLGLLLVVQASRFFLQLVKKPDPKLG